MAVPLNHRKPTAEEAKTAMKITPDTYSGVAVVAIEKVESVLSVLDPYFIPANTPTISAIGTISIRTQNISFPVSPNRVETSGPTSSLKTVE